MRKESGVKVKVKANIEIGSHTYKILFNEVVGVDGHDATVVHKLQQIWIDPKVPITRNALSLIHEVLHIICNVYCVNLDEREVESLSQGLGQLLFSKHNLGIELDWSDIKHLKFIEENSEP